MTLQGFIYKCNHHHLKLGGGFLWVTPKYKLQSCSKLGRVHVACRHSERKPVLPLQHASSASWLSACLSPPCVMATAASPRISALSLTSFSLHPGETLPALSTSDPSLLGCAYSLFSLGCVDFHTLVPSLSGHCLCFPDDDPPLATRQRPALVSGWLPPRLRAWSCGIRAGLLLCTSLWLSEALPLEQTP